MELQHKITSSEFAEWVAYFDGESNHFNPLHWYFAQISRDIIATVVGGTKAGKIEDYLLKFEKKVPQVESVPQETEKKSSKQIFLSWLGIKSPNE